MVAAALRVHDHTTSRGGGVGKLLQHTPACCWLRGARLLRGAWLVNVPTDRHAGQLRSGWVWFHTEDRLSGGALAGSGEGRSKLLRRSAHCNGDTVMDSCGSARSTHRASAWPQTAPSSPPASALSGGSPLRSCCWAARAAWQWVWPQHAPAAGTQTGGGRWQRERPAAWLRRTDRDAAWGRRGMGVVR